MNPQLLCDVLLACGVIACVGAIVRQARRINALEAKLAQSTKMDK